MCPFHGSHPFETLFIAVSNENVMYILASIIGVLLMLIVFVYSRKRNSALKTKEQCIKKGGFGFPVGEWKKMKKEFEVIYTNLC